MEIPSPDAKAISTLLKSNFVVPAYQRGYAWNNRTFSDFWTDLADLVDGKRQQHFFGQIVTLKSGENRFDLIDGQQRITTSVVFLAAINAVIEHFIRQNKDDRLNERDIRKLHLIQDRVAELLRLDEEQSVLTVNLKLQEDFEKTVQSINLISPSERTIYSAPFNYFIEQLRGDLNNLKNINEQLGYLEKIYKVFTEKFYVVLINTDRHQDAFVIFETLNSRGEDLTSADLLKNHLLMLVGDEYIKEASEQWNIITDSIDGDAKEISRFVRSYWAAKKALYTDEKLYRELHTAIETSQDAREVLDELVTLSPLYKNVSKGLKSQFDNENLGNIIHEFKNLSIKLHYPIVLALRLAGTDESRQVHILQNAMSTFIRYRTIMGWTTNNLEKGFSRVAQEIYARNKSHTEIINMLKALRPKEFEVKSRWEELILTLQKGEKGPLRYILKKIYENENETLSIQATAQNYDVVRIGSAEQVGEESADKIANYTLLEKSLRQGYDERDLSTVAERLKKSKILSNKQIAQEIINWDKDRIDQRQKELWHSVQNLWI